MPHEPTREAAGARQLIEAASAFARREMLAEARQALQAARAALALRSDVGTAHWCDACLVALEIAVRADDSREMEAEAAQLRSFSGGGRYWTEQARARIGEHGKRIAPARLDRVFAVLVGDAEPTAHHRAHPPASEAAFPDDAPCRPPTSPAPSRAPIHKLADDVGEQPDTLPGEGDAESDRTIPAPSADTRATRPSDTEKQAGHCTGPLADTELEAAEIGIPDPPPLSRAAANANSPEIFSAAPRLKSATKFFRRSGVQNVILSVVALSAVLWASRSAAGLSAVLSRSSASGAEHALRTGNTARALQMVSVPDAGEAAPHKHLALGWALLAAGDTAGAVKALAQAAQTDSRGTVAWAAAETLARLPGHSASAADAYLLAFAAGLPAERAETVARAQELAGRPDRAQRVREQASIR